MSIQLKTITDHLKNPAFWLVFLFLIVLVLPAIVWDELNESFRSKKLLDENRAFAKKPRLQFCHPIHISHPL